MVSNPLGFYRKAKVNHLHRFLVIELCFFFLFVSFHCDLKINSLLALLDKTLFKPQLMPFN